MRVSFWTSMRRTCLLAIIILIAGGCAKSNDVALQSLGSTQSGKVSEHPALPPRIESITPRPELSADGESWFEVRGDNLVTAAGSSFVAAATCQDSQGKAHPSSNPDGVIIVDSGLNGIFENSTGQPLKGEDGYAHFIFMLTPTSSKMNCVLHITTRFDVNQEVITYHSDDTPNNHPNFELNGSTKQQPRDQPGDTVPTPTPTPTPTPSPLAPTPLPSPSAQEPDTDTSTLYTSALCDSMANLNASALSSTSLLTYCQCIQCGYITQTQAGLANLYTCSSGGYVGVYPKTAPQCLALK